MDWLEAMHANMLRAARRIGSLTDAATAEERGPWLLIDAGVGMPRFNQALLRKISSDPAGDVGVALDWFDARGVEGSFLMRDPLDAPVAAELRRCGLEVAESEPAMLLRPLPAASASLHPGLTVRDARSEAEIVRYAEVDARAWRVVTLGIARTARDFPDFTMLLGELDGRAVATSMAVVTGDIVGIYNVQVKPELRGRGFGRAMTDAAIACGGQAGCSAAALQSTPMGLPLYTAMGFETQYNVEVYARPGSLD